MVMSCEMETRQHGTSRLLQASLARLLKCACLAILLAESLCIVTQIVVSAPKEGGMDQVVLSHGARPKGQGLSDSSLLGTASVSDSYDVTA